MSVAQLISEIRKLTPEERLECQEILNELNALPNNDEDEDGLTAEEYAELKERIEDWKKHPETSIPFEESKAKMFARFGL